MQINSYDKSRKVASCYRKQKPIKQAKNIKLLFFAHSFCLNLLF